MNKNAKKTRFPSGFDIDSIRHKHLLILSTYYSNRNGKNHLIDVIECIHLAHSTYFGITSLAAYILHLT